MATIEALVHAGVLHPIGGSRAAPVGQPRRLYASKSFLEWLKHFNDTNPPSLEGLDEKPKLQLYNLLKKYISGEPLVFDREFHPMQPGETNIWETKTAELRIFGFFNDVDCFVAVVGDYKERILTYRLYSTYRDQTERFRTLHEIPYLTENGVHHVLS